MTDIPRSLLTKEINLNEEITVTLNYQGDPDSLFYTGVLVYDRVPVSVMDFNYITFKF